MTASLRVSKWANRRVGRALVGAGREMPVGGKNAVAGDTGANVRFDKEETETKYGQECEGKGIAIPP